MRYDSEGLTLDDREIGRRLEALGADEGAQVFVLKVDASTVNPEEEIDEIERSLVYLARYGRQSDVRYWEQQPVTRVNSWLRMVSELIKAENESSRTETDGG